MLRFDFYNLIIFDCDGVLFDSNNLKIEAMGLALRKVGGLSIDQVEECQNFFRRNFGKSRFYHIEYFAENILKIKDSSVETFKSSLLEFYSEMSSDLYLTAPLARYVEELLTVSSAVKYVASGSEQGELRDVLSFREIGHYFMGVLGSPEKKVTNVSRILKAHQECRGVLIGDAVSDLQAARENNIDFVFYSPYSNVEPEMRALCLRYNYRVIDSFKEIIKEI